MVLEPMSPKPAMNVAGYSMVVWWLGTQLLAAQTFMSLPEAPSSSRAFCGVQAGKTAWQAVGHVFAPATGYPLRCEIRRLDVCLASAAAIAKISKITPLTRMAAMGMVRRVYRVPWVETGEGIAGSRAPAVRAAGVARFSNDTGERSTGEKADSLGNGVSSNVVDASHLRWARREVAASRF